MANMNHILHITNGDGAANILKQSQLGGDVLPWRDPMHHGPFPGGLALDEISEIRSHYLAADASLDKATVVRDFKLRNEHLRAATRYDEVVLWFEHDLLDQLQLLQLLDWFNTAENTPDRLTLICIDRFEGKDLFRGLGELNVDEMASLIDQRRPVSDEQLKLASLGWSAFCAPSPEVLMAFIQSDTNALPFMAAALSRHLQEYPWLSDGLTRTERQLLNLVAGGVNEPGRLFVANMELETVLYIGDWPTYSTICALSDIPRPLLVCESGKPFLHPNQLSTGAFGRQKLALSSTGRQVLAGTINASDVIDRDQWLGGVHLKSGGTLWWWDDANNALVRA